MWLTCDCNFFIKLISMLILIFAIIVNGIGNFLGFGDIIETKPHSCYTTTVTEEPTTVEDKETTTDYLPEPSATVAPTQSSTAASTTEQEKTTATEMQSTSAQPTSQPQSAAPTTTKAPTTALPTVPGPTFGPPVIVNPATTQAPATEAPTTETTTEIQTTETPTTQTPTTTEPPTTEPEKTYVIPQPTVLVYDELYSILVVPPVVDGCEITLAIEPEAQYVDMGNGMQGFVEVVPGTTYSITACGTVDGVDESSKPIVVTVYDPVIPEKPVLQAVTHNSISVEYDERCEYRLYSNQHGYLYNWSDKTQFEKLSPETEYTVYVRYKENGVHAQGNEEADITIKTSAAPTTTSQPTTAAPTTAAPTTARPTTTKPSTTKKTTASTTKAPTTDGGPYLNAASEIALAIFGGSSGNIGTVVRGMDALPEGGYVACGTTASVDGDFEGLCDESLNWNIPFSFVAKFSRAGTVEWVKLYGDSRFSVSLYDIAVLSNGNIVTVGSYTPSPYEEKIDNDAVIITLSSKGTELSKNFHAGSGNDFFYCVSATHDGYAVGGKTTSTDGAFLGVPGMSSIVINFNSNNEVLWKHYFNGTKSSHIGGIDVDSDGNIFLACITTTTDGLFSSFEGLFGSYADTVIMKFDYAGDFQWYQVLATSGSDEFDSIAADGKGGCVVAGNYTLTSAVSPDGTLKGIHNCGDTDALVFRFNKNGERQWYKIVSGFYDDYITDIVAADGGYAVTGYTTSANREFASIGNKGGTDGFIYFLDVNGTGIEVLSQAGFDDDSALCLAYSDDNRELLVAGNTCSTDGSFEGINTYADSSTGYVGRYKISVGY
ncbi:MAG: hypothetical protein IJE19_05390 [Clostridia bacterium]|nr:hypothetical protein [Clostridia bacterium]